VTRLLALAAVLAIAGCGTYLAKDNSGWGAPYAGTECALGLPANLVEVPLNLLLPFAIVDIPVSMIADTLLLPVDLMKKSSTRFVDCSI
jgi:uncharacterized protein YceK